MPPPPLCHFKHPASSILFPHFYDASNFAYLPRSRKRQRIPPSTSTSAADSVIAFCIYYSFRTRNLNFLPRWMTRSPFCRLTYKTSSTITLTSPSRNTIQSYSRNSPRKSGSRRIPRIPARSRLRPDCRGRRNRLGAARSRCTRSSALSPS